MRIAFSVPSGFHTRELLLPLKNFLERDTNITEVIVITPAAPYHREIFPSYTRKFVFHVNPPDLSAHQELLRRTNPDIVVTNTSGLDPNDVPILRAAKQLGIPTVTFIASWDNAWKVEGYQKKNLPLEIADHVIVWNTMMRDHYHRLFPSLKRADIAVIGAPRLDFFWHHSQIPSPTELRNYLGIPQDNGKLIHFATTELYPTDYIIKSIRKAQRSGLIKEKLHLYASVHPGGDIRQHKHYADKYGVTIRYSFGRHEKAPHPDFLYSPSLADTHMLVAAFTHFDLLINHSSTVAIESFLGNTPVINVKYGRTLDGWRWRRSVVYRDFTQHYADITKDGATTVVKNKHQLIEAINTYLAHPEKDQEARQRTLKRMITATDGTASEQVLKLIKQLSKQ